MIRLDVNTNGPNEGGSSSEQPTQPNLQGRKAEVIWGLGYEEGRTWIGYFYTLAQLLSGVCSNPSWTVRKEITVADKHWHLVTPEWYDLAVVVLPILNGEMMDCRERLFNTFRGYEDLNPDSSIIAKITDLMQNREKEESCYFLNQILSIIDIAGLTLTERMVDATLSLAIADRDVRNLRDIFKALRSIESEEEIDDVVRHSRSLLPTGAGCCFQGELLKAISSIPREIREKVIAKAEILTRNSSAEVIHWDEILFRCSREVVESYEVDRLDSFQMRTIPPYSSLGDEALAFARGKMREISETRVSRYMPLIENKEIAMLDALLADLYASIYSRGREQPVTTEELDEFMKVGFAVSCLTLDELDLFICREASRGVNKTRTQALIDPDSYPCSTFYSCTQVYHAIREEGSPSPFYREGTIQHSWNFLYNEYCDRIRLYVNEKRLAKQDPRFVNWTRKDIEPSTFEKLSYDFFYKTC